MGATPELGQWVTLAQTINSYEQNIKIAIVGKYTGLADAYLSIIKVQPVVVWVVSLTLAP
jgi:CTP synthase (UTP-ammonia lyase)